MAKPLNVVISGTGMALPTEVLDNDYFAAYLDTSDEWITARSGIKQRFRATSNESTSTMAYEASVKAIADAGITAKDLDMILVATATPDTLVPSTACWIGGMLGVSEIAAFDINAACAGLTYGMAQAAMYIASGGYKNILVIGAESLSRITDYEDRSTCVLFGDAACALIMSPSPDPNRGLLWYKLGADGACADYIWVPAGGAKLPSSAMTIAERLHFIKMKGREVYKFAVIKFNRLVQQALDETGFKPEDLDYIIPHQSNLRIIESVQQRLGLPMEKFAVNIDRYGNTSAASVGLALDEARRSGRVKAGDLVLMVALGAGLTWGVTLFRM